MTHEQTETVEPAETEQHVQLLEHFKTASGYGDMPYIIANLKIDPKGRVTTAFKQFAHWIQAEINDPTMRYKRVNAFVKLQLALVDYFGTYGEKGGIMFSGEEKENEALIHALNAKEHLLFHAARKNAAGQQNNLDL